MAAPEANVPEMEKAIRKAQKSVKDMDFIVIKKGGVSPALLSSDM